MCLSDGVSPFSLRSDATIFHASIRRSGNRFAIRRISACLNRAAVGFLND